MILYYFYSRRVCSYKRTDASNGVDVKGQTFGGEVSSGPMLPAVIGAFHFRKRACGDLERGVKRQEGDL